MGRHAAFLEAVRRLNSGAGATLSGLTTTAKALYSVLLWQVAGRPLILVVDGNKQAEALAEAVGTFFGMLVGAEHLPAASTRTLVSGFALLEVSMTAS